MSEKSIKLDKVEAYLAMYAFLEEYYKKTNSDEIAGLLGSMSLLPDGNVVDKAIEQDWDDAVGSVLRGEVHAELGLNKNT